MSAFSLVLVYSSIQYLGHPLLGVGFPFLQEKCRQSHYCLERFIAQQCKLVQIEGN